MNINFIDDPNVAPVKREEMQILAVALTPYPDTRRVKIEIETTAFVPADRPSLEITIKNPEQTEVSSATIIEAMQTLTTFTLHLKNNSPGDYAVSVRLYYDEETSQHTLTEIFSLNKET